VATVFLGTKTWLPAWRNGSDD